MVAKKETSDDEEDKDEEAEEQNAASLWYDTLVRRAEIGDVAGDTFATIMDVLHLTPRYVSTCPSAHKHIINCSKTEVDSTLTYTRVPFAFEERLMTIRFNMTLSRNSSSYPSQTRPTLSSPWDWTPPCAKGKQDIRSL